jgi:hypothetical protein
MRTRRASDEGKRKIKEAIDKKNKGVWKLESPRWIDLANTVIKEDSEKTEKYFSIVANQQSWKRFRLGKNPIDEQVFNTYCKILELDPNEIAENPSSIYGFVRLPEERNIFNDYLGETAIDELWADPLATNHGGDTESYIKVSVKSEENEENEEKAFLKVVFVRQGWGVNLTVRPMNDSPINASKFKHMKIKLRSPEKTLIGIRVRVTDANNICWGYGGSILFYESENLSTKSDTWSKESLISLDQRRWFHFPYDGCKIKPWQLPDFTQIQLITFEVGFEPDVTNDGKCNFTGFSLNKISEGEIHINPIEFE